MAMEIVAGLTEIGRVTDPLWAGFPESLTLKVSGVWLAAAVGVPVMAPLDAFRESPVGKVPLVRVQESGVVPPVAASVTE
jgi:hypothetical protein